MDFNLSTRASHWLKDFNHGFVREGLFAFQNNLAGDSKDYIAMNRDESGRGRDSYRIPRFTRMLVVEVKGSGQTWFVQRSIPLSSLCKAFPP